MWIRALLLGLFLGLGFPGAGGPPLASTPVQAQEAEGVLQGRVLGKRGASTVPLSNALIQGRQGRHYFATESGARGAFRVEGLSPGMWSLDVMHVGHESLRLDVQVPGTGGVEVEVELPWAPVELQGLTIRAIPAAVAWEHEGPSGLARGEVALRALEAGTGMGQSGMAALVQSLPGEGPAHRDDVLLMRGAASDLKLVLLDGAPVYTPFHVGGLVEGLDPFNLGGASLFLGGAPARYDGGLSYILDLHTRSPRGDRIRGRASLDLLSESVALEGPLPGSGGFLLSSRALHDLGTPLLGRDPSPYGYVDGLARLGWSHESGIRAFLTGFWNREEVDLDLTRAVLGPETEMAEGPQGPLLEELLPGGAARWGNGALAAGVRVESGETRGELRLTASRYQARLPLGDSLPSFARGESDRVRLTADLFRSLKEGDLRLGGSFDLESNAYEVQRLLTSSGTSHLELDSEGESGGLYGEFSRLLTPEVRLRGGLRADWFSTEQGLRMAPRLALTWLLSDQAALTLALGRYHQHLPMTMEEVNESMAEDHEKDALRDGGAGMTVGSANHLVLALDQVLTPGIRLGVEGFVKEFRGVPGARGSVLHASGTDFRVAREGERISGWLGYTLTWFWASQDPLGAGESFTGRHLLSGGLAARLGRRTGVTLDVGYGSGLPYTTVPLVDRESTVTGPSDGADPVRLNTDQVLMAAPGVGTAVPPDQSFLRVDGKIFGSFEAPVWGRVTEIRPYVKVLNALGRRDALFYHFQRWRTEGPRPLAELPVLPVVGLEWRF